MTITYRLQTELNESLILSRLWRSSHCSEKFPLRELRLEQCKNLEKSAFVVLLQDMAAGKSTQLVPSPALSPLPWILDMSMYSRRVSGVFGHLH
ncbi:hypothetical protein NC653_004868 [Populus alba x Populus x berolinensis]|uniref:Uncharacterized protein n=1 Tax=Populus alba x Populus x berolinensis TaxID=444605 RepID=A0AAD6RV20_9ROSI|nr:hypothetical protein NC653_004868 [Populus alba x Populus x berolinensis]